MNKLGHSSLLISPARGFVSLEPATRWDDAMISGNGVMGAMVYGQPLREIIVLNRSGLFMPWHEPLPPVDTAPHLPEIRRMLADGEYQRAADYVVELSHREGWGEKRWTDPFIPAFDLCIDMQEQGSVQRYGRGVDFSTGVASVGWEDNRGTFLRRLFVSREHNVVALSATCSTPGSLHCSLRLAIRPVVQSGEWLPDLWVPEAHFSEGIAEVDISSDVEWMTYRSRFKRGWPGSLQGYEGVARVVVRGGTAVADGGSITLRGADEILLLVCIELSKDFANSQVEEIKWRLSRIPAIFDELLEQHARIHGEIFQRVRLDLDGAATGESSSEELIAHSQVGHISPALLEKQFDAGRYAILSSTGELAPLLPGIWTGTWGPPWSGDYTRNGNLQTSIAANLSTNMAELMEPYFRQVELQMPAYRENARRLYGCRGIHIPSRTSSHGLNNHFDRTWPMTFWTAGAGWEARFFYEYYQYKGDREFLSQRAVPFMKEAVAFYEDFLFAGPDSAWVFSPSYSPENHPGNEPSQACINATMDIAVARELLTNLIAACETLGVDTEGVQHWREMLVKLPAYQVNSDGALKEWTTPLLEDNYEHRHASHLYPLYYGMPPELEGDAALREAFRRAVELRMDFRRGDTRGEMAFGVVQLAQIAVSLRDSQMCSELVSWLSNLYWTNAMTSTHDARHIFNVDLCGGLPEIISRMLVESRTGEIDLLPVILPELPSGSVEGLCCRGQIVVRRLAWSPNRIEVALASNGAQQVTLNLPRPAESVSGANGAEISMRRISRSAWIVDLSADRTVQLEFQLEARH